MPAQQAQFQDPVAAVPPIQQQQLGTTYGKVAAWLNGTYSSSAAGSTAFKARPGSGPPLINKFSSSLLWYVGLGGALHHKHRTGNHNTQQQDQQQHGSAPAGAAAPNGNAPPAAAAPTAALAGQASTAAAAPVAPAQQGLPMRPPGVLQAGTSGPTSHPLTMKQIEQSMEFSTSSSVSGPATAPVQAVSKGTKRVHACAALCMFDALYTLVQHGACVLGHLRS